MIFLILSFGPFIAVFYVDLLRLVEGLCKKTLHNRAITHHLHLVSAKVLRALFDSNTSRLERSTTGT
jgi:hypothetical protein